MAQFPAAVEFLRIPPFPGARPLQLAICSGHRTQLSDQVVDQLLRRVTERKVGGTYWGRQPQLPQPGFTVVRTKSDFPQPSEISGGILELPQESAVDPWHVLSTAGAVVADADDELLLLGAIAGIPLRCIGPGRFSALETGGHPAIREAFRAVAADGVTYRNPFSGEEMNIAEAIELCGFWRSIIDRNRDLTAALGFAFWKRKTVAPLLWDGTSDPPFASRRRQFNSDDRVAVWKSRTAPRRLQQLERSGAHIVEVEDGFIRSTGLGADCVPPLSIVVDSRGIYFDPQRPSDLEHLLQQGPFTPEILLRARDLRHLIVGLGVSKYGASSGKLERRGEQPHLLVVGQVEDDRAVLAGLGPTTNLQLLQRVREENQDSYIIYKPHPDVEAGHRAGAIDEEECLRLADEVVRDVSISPLIDLTDEIHVNTSLAGFEALLRGKKVITYGVPFYAGWGLTRDLASPPHRRNANRNIDELVAAALLLYPRYLDPITGLPCPPEILVRRIGEEMTNPEPTRLVRLRRLQGKWKRSLAVLRSTR